MTLQPNEEVPLVDSVFGFCSFGFFN